MPGDEQSHLSALRNVSGQGRFRDFDVFEPLSADDYRELSDNDELSAMEDTALLRLWIRPISRWLQQKYRIDQRNYSTSTDPTLAELQEDFSVAVAICVNKFSRNKDELSGQVSVGRSGSHVWDYRIPPRAVQILARYEVAGGQVGRS